MKSVTLHHGKLSLMRLRQACDAKAVACFSLYVNSPERMYCKNLHRLNLAINRQVIDFVYNEFHDNNPLLCEDVEISESTACKH